MENKANKFGFRCVGVIAAGVLVVVCIVIGVTIWSVKGNKVDKPASGTLKVKELNIAKSDLALSITNNDEITLRGVLWSDKSSDDKPSDISTTNSGQTLTWTDDRILEISSDTFSDVTCYKVNWTATRCIAQTLKDCYDMSTVHWYGGFEDFHQHWPLENTVRNTTPFVAMDTYNDQIGQVQERYFVSTSGIGIFIEHGVPLYISINESNNQQLCLSAKYDDIFPYPNQAKIKPHLTYHMCQGKNVRHIHDFMANKFWSKPSGIAAEDLFKSPIWSTWAQYKKEINQSTILEFANNILSHNLSHSQLEIDDDWTTKYGDLDFDLTKFPDPKYMIGALTSLGFNVTVWVHPFCNLDSACFMEGSLKGYFVRQYESKLPALVSWWDGAAATLDVTNEMAVNWYLDKLKEIQNKYGVVSFKFDAGGTTFVPKASSFSDQITSANVYPEQWARLAYMSDNTSRRQEIRVGFHTQDLPIFVRMLDLFSGWGRDNGLEKLIPCALTFGILGYPFVLPDMIGGNAYENRTADKELFIRWMQVNTFLPSIQFSLVPWSYDEETINITRHTLDLREQYADLIIELAHNSTVTGHPIVRPLWWVAPDDPVAQVIDSEYLLGDDVLVAPVLQQNATQRDIYLPEGIWLDMLRGGNITGPGWCYNYTAQLHELPFFIRNS